MTKPFLKNKILNEFLLDRTLMDITCPLKDYNFKDFCLMSPFYYTLQAIKEVGYSDYYSAMAFIEEAQTYDASLLMIKVALSLIALEKNDIDLALKYKNELTDSFEKRPSLHRFYLRAMDEVYSADYRLFRKWYPLLCIKIHICQDPFINRKENGALIDFRKSAIKEGVSGFWLDIYESDSFMFAFHVMRNQEYQEIEINNLIFDYYSKYYNKFNKLDILIKNINSKKINCKNNNNENINDAEINSNKNGNNNIMSSSGSNNNSKNNTGGKDSYIKGSNNDDEFRNDASGLDSIYEAKNIFCNFVIQQIYQLIEQYEILQQYKKTLYWCDVIWTLNPNAIKVLAVKIEVLKKMKMFHCALGFCNTFIANNPKDSVGYFLRSNIYFQLNDNVKALQDAQSCYQMSGDKKMGLIARGFALLNMEDFEKALGCFETVCSLGNPSYEAYRGLGKAYAALDKTIEALECYMKCKRIDPLDLDLLYDIADTQFMGGYYREAKHSCNACIEENPYFVGPYVILGMIALREENETLAMKYFDKTIELDPKNPYALNEKGFLLFLSGHIEDSIKFIDLSLIEFPEYADAYCNKGIILSSKNELDEAFECFENALLIVPEHVGANLGKANLLLHENRIDDALENFELVLKLNPTNEDALRAKEVIVKIMDLSMELSSDLETDEY